MASSFTNKSSDPRLRSYAAVKPIGKGSYGEVFLVKHSKEKKQYVMKNIKLTASSVKERLAAEQEAVLLGKLKHPNIVSYKESFQDEHGMLHIVMGYCEGGDLCTRLKTCKGQYLPETQVVEWFVQIALGLQYLHERNILHRDLKTQNIFLSKNDIIKVGDLGIARVLDGSCDLAHTVIGTPYYMSPELFANEPYNHKSDIWALGCCVYEMATLKHAFTATNLNALMYKIIKGTVPSLPNVFTSELSVLVHSMMSHSAASRPSVQELLRNAFVRKHIKLFLDRAASKKKKKPPVTRDPPSDKLGLATPNVSSSKSHPLAAPQIRVRCSSIGSSSREENTVKKQKPSDAAKRATSLTNLSQKPTPTETVAHSPATAGRDPPTVAAEGDPTTVAAEGDQPTVAAEGDPTTVAAEGDPTTATAGRDPPTVDKPPVKMSKHKQSNGEDKRLSEKNRGAKRPPRPLPPDPAKRASVGCVILDSPKVSSARERRRMNKVKGRVVLKSRSSSDLSKGEKAQSSDDLSKQSSSTEHSPKIDKCVVLENGCKEMVSHDLLPSSGSSHEVDEFLTLLDTTLHLPEPPVRAASGDTPPARQAFIQEQPSVSHEVSQAMLQSGRLGDRIVALRKECVAGLGEAVMKEASLILQQQEPDEAEELLLKVLGQKQFNLFAAKLQHLNFCEDNVRTPL